MPTWRATPNSSQTRRALVTRRRSGLAAGVGQVELLAALGLVGPDQALVLELLERGVDRARAGAPDALAAALDLLHELVAVARLLGEEREQRGADVAAARARTATAPRATRPAAEAHRPAPEVPAAVAVPAVMVAAGHREPAEPARVEPTRRCFVCHVGSFHIDDR
jgi:hypothetical protein